MSIFHRNILNILFLILVLGATSFFTYRALFLKEGDPWEYVPGNALAVIQLNPDEFFARTYPGSSRILEELSSHPHLGVAAKGFLMLDSLYHTHPDELKQLERSPILLVVLPQGNEFITVMVANAANGLARNSWDKVIGMLGGNPEGGNEHLIPLQNNSGINLQLHFSEQMAFITSSKKTETEISEMLKNSVAPGSLLKLQQAVKNKSSISLFIRDDLLSGILHGGNREIAKSIGAEGWSHFDITIKKDEGFISGYVGDEFAGIKELNSGMKYQHTFPEGIPLNSKSTSGLGVQCLHLNPENDTSPDNSEICFGIYKIVTSDSTSVLLFSPTDSVSQNWLALSSEIQQAMVAKDNILSTLSHDSSQRAAQDTATIFHKVVRGQLIAGAERATVNTVAADIRARRSVSNSGWFKNMADNLPDSAGLWGYIDAGMPQLDSETSLSLSNVIWALQAGKGNLLTASLSISEGSTAAPIPTQTSQETYSRITHRPFPVWDHRNRVYNVLIFDESNTAILYNPEGKVLWDYSLDGSPLGDIEVVDAFKNGKFQYLFNTEKTIYLIDLEGNDVEGFPVSIPSGASNSLVALDYDGRKDYRILVACTDRKIRNFDIHGKLVDGWREPEMTSLVTVPIQHIAMYRKDYIIIPDEGGEVIMTDRRGDIRVRIRRSFTNAAQTPFFMQRINGETRIITTDINGNIRALRRNGRVKTIRIQEMQAGHQFIYAPFISSRESDYIFFNDGQLLVYDKEGKLQMQASTDEEIIQGPKVISIGSRRFIALVSTSGNTLLFREGSNEVYRTIEADFLPTIIDLDQDLQAEMLTASGNKLIMRPVEAR